MAKEIERKFLVASDKLAEILESATTSYTIAQAYLFDDGRKSVRVRLKGESAYLTIKISQTHTTRLEYEYQIPVSDAKGLFNQCETGRIEKERFEIPMEGKVWEVDVFKGENKGLIVAEIELNSESDEFNLPDWIESEVTHDSRYLNTSLAKIPFSTWKKS
jgi:adenylate cyclase